MRLELRTLTSVLILACLAACGPKPEAPDKVTTVGSTETVNGKVISQSGLRLTNYSVAQARGAGTATGAYVTVTNTGSEGDRLLSAACDCADEASLHTMTMKGDMMEMKEVAAGFEIPPGQTLVLAPGGNHIMLMGLKQKPVAGQTQKLTLTFAKAGTVVIDAPVK